VPRGPDHSEPNGARRWKILTIFPLQLTFARVKGRKLGAFIALYVTVGLVIKKLTYLTTDNGLECFINGNNVSISPR